MCILFKHYYKKKDERVFVIHKENGGLSDARNVGIDIASGKYLTFIDSDDKISFDMIEYLWKKMVSENAEMSVCQCDYIDEMGNIFENNKNFNDLLIVGSENCIKVFLSNPEFNTVAWGKLYKREFWQNVRYPVGKYHEDIFTTYRLVDLCSKIVIGKEKKYLYRKRRTSISNGKPVLVMRDTTERPEGVNAGTLRLVGTDEEIIYNNFKELLENQEAYATMAKACNPYGDGHACERIADILEGKDFIPWSGI